MKKNKVCMLIVAIITLILVGISLYFIWKNANSNIISNIKKNKSKDLIYQAEYSVKGLEEAWYYCETLGEERSINDIKVPYINIDSKDANSANAELKKLFNKTAENFKEEYDKTYNTNERI